MKVNYKIRCALKYIRREDTRFSVVLKCENSENVCVVNSISPLRGLIIIEEISLRT